MKSPEFRVSVAAGLLAPLAAFALSSCNRESSSSTPQTKGPTPTAQSRVQCRASQPKVTLDTNHYASVTETFTITNERGDSAETEYQITNKGSKVVVQDTAGAGVGATITVPGSIGDLTLNNVAGTLFEATISAKPLPTPGSVQVTVGCAKGA